MVAASAVLVATFLLVRDEKAAVAVPAGATIGFVVIVAVAVALGGWASQMWRPSAVLSVADAPSNADDETAGPANGAQGGLSIAQGLVLLLTFGVLTAVPAAIIVAAVTILGNRGTVLPQVALPVILLVGMVGLLGVLAMTVAVLARFGLVNKRHPLGLPQGSIQAVIALSLILIFAIVGVYLHASSAPGKAKETLSTQLLTTISTLVIAVSSFYFGAKTTKEAAVAAVQAAGGGAQVADELSEPEALAQGEVDEASVYGTASPVTGVGGEDVADELTSPPLEEETTDEVASPAAAEEPPEEEPA